MFSIILAAAMAISPSVAARNEGARQLDHLINNIEQLQEDADAVGNTARTRPSVRTIKRPRAPLKMDFRNGPRVL